MTVACIFSTKCNSKFLHFITQSTCPPNAQNSRGQKNKMSFTLVTWNAEWAKKMIVVGLIPSTTCNPRGQIVGPIENGVFLQALDKMPDRLKFPFISTEAEARYMVMISVGSSPAATAAPWPTQ